MKKRDIKRILKENAVKKSTKVAYDYQINDSYITLVNSNSNTQITINSPSVYEVQSGKLNGIRYIKKSSVITRFDKNDHLVLVLLNQPYRILKYINENEIVDISEDKKVHNIDIVQSLEQLESIIKKAV